MKSYRVRMTEGVEMVVRHDDEPIADFIDAVQRAVDGGLLLRVELSGTSGETVAINPRHVLYVREVAE